MAYDELESCCIKVYCDFEDMKLKPGKESWVRHPDCQKSLCNLIRDVWINECGGIADEWPWNDAFVILAFIRVRKKNQDMKAANREKMKNGTLFPLPSGIIYFIRNSRGHVKIGWTTNDPELRLAQLQTAESEPLSLAAWMPGHERQEKVLHARFAAFRMQGEWFHPSKELEDLINRNLK